MVYVMNGKHAAARGGNYGVNINGDHAARGSNCGVKINGEHLERGGNCCE